MKFGTLAWLVIFLIHCTIFCNELTYLTWQSPWVFDLATGCRMWKAFFTMFPPSMQCAGGSLEDFFHGWRWSWLWISTASRSRAPLLRVSQEASSSQRREALAFQKSWKNITSAGRWWVKCHWEFLPSLAVAQSFHRRRCASSPCRCAWSWRWGFLGVKPPGILNFSWRIYPADGRCVLQIVPPTFGALPCSPTIMGEPSRIRWGGFCVNL